MFNKEPVKGVEFVDTPPIAEPVNPLNPERYAHWPTISDISKEPDYVEALYECIRQDKDSVDKVRAWQRWARDKIEQGRSKIHELENTISQHKTQIQEQSEAIKGMQAWQKLSKPTVEVYELGAEVKFGPIGREKTGKISSVILSKGGTLYTVIYWTSDTSFQTQTLPQDEVRVVQDML